MRGILLYLQSEGTVIRLVGATVIDYMLLFYSVTL